MFPQGLKATARGPQIDKCTCTTLYNNNSEDDWLSTAIGCLICIAFLVLFLFILSYPVSGSYRYEPDTDRHHVYFRANPNAYPYAP